MRGGGSRGCHRAEPAVESRLLSAGMVWMSLVLLHVKFSMFDGLLAMIARNTMQDYNPKWHSTTNSSHVPT